jgi:hypothetical protein
LLAEKIDHVVFRAVDSEGNDLIIKVDKWKGNELDASAPSLNYAALEAYLLDEEGIEVTITDHAVVSGSYDDSDGGIFLSDGSPVAEGDIDDYWFGDAWTDKKGGEFDDKRVDYDLDFKHLPDDLQGKDSFATKESDYVDESAIEEGVEADVGANQESLTLLSDLGVENVEMSYSEVVDGSDEGDVMILGLDDDSTTVSSAVAESVDLAIDAEDLLASEDELSGLLSASDPQDIEDQRGGRDIDATGLDDNYRLDFEDGDSTEHFD